MSFGEIPNELKARDQWLLWDSSNSRPRQPHWRGDFNGISWSNPDDWHSFEEACEAAAERETWGIGYVTAVDNTDYARGLFGVIDLDGCADSNGAPKDWVPGIKPFVDRDAYIEWSPSGTGLHIPVWNIDTPDWWSDVQIDDHEGVDVLTNKFCTFTGDCETASGEEVVDMGDWLVEWLADAYENITGETAPPRQNTTFDDYSSTEETNNDYDGPELTEEQVVAALDHVDEMLHFNDWLKVGFAVYDWDSGARGKRIFEEWSQSNAKSNPGSTEGQGHINDIWDNDSPNGSVSVGTLIHHAIEGGWDGPGSTAADGGTSTDESGGSSTEDTDGDAGLKSWDQIRGLYAQKSQATTDEARYQSMRRCEDEMSFVAGIENEQLRVYDKDRGFYTAHAEQRVRGYLGDDNRLRHAYKRRRGNAVANILIDRNGVPLAKIGGPTDKLCLGNYVLDISDPERPRHEEHAPEYYFAAGYPVNYDPEADCPRWRAFIKDAVEPDDREKLQEFFGYCLLHDQQPFKKAAFLVGPTDSGKGTALRVLQAILGSENVANETLYNLMNTRWAANSLHGRVANIRNEISPAGVGNVQKFKELVGGEDRIDAEDKHKPKYEFAVTQKFIFATNRFPQVEHADEAFYNRLLFISFPKRVPDSEKDPDLPEKLLSESSGILNWMLDGLARLLDRGEFAGLRGQETKESLVDKFGGPIDRFVHACLEVTGDADDLVHKSDLHDLMLAYAQRNGMDERPQQGAFTRAMKTNGGIDDTNARFAAGGDSDKAFTGVRVEPKATAALDVTVRSRTSDGDSTGSQGTL